MDIRLHQKLRYVSTNDSRNCDTMDDILVEATVTSIDYFAPIKTNKEGGNHTRYLRRDLSKAIINRSILKTIITKTLLLKIQTLKELLYVFENKIQKRRLRKSKLKL